MIVSHKHKFIFIKTEKTAGTSMEIALSKICGPSDIITPISKADETLRWKHGGLPPQNHLIPFSKYSKKDWLDLFYTKKRHSFRNHVGADFIKNHLDKPVWETYYKFCFERNPWDKVVSFYFWRFKSEPRPPFSEFVQSSEANRIRGFELYTIQSQVAVNQVYLFEDLPSSLIHIAESLKLPLPFELPYAKSEFRENKKTYREMLTDRDRDKIAIVYAREIALFRYQF